VGRVEGVLEAAVGVLHSRLINYFSGEKGEHARGKEKQTERGIK